MTVTYSRKRYVGVCFGCAKLFLSVRRDQACCSPSCRVKAHRNGSLKRAQEACKAHDLSGGPAQISHHEAADALLPDFRDRVMADRDFDIEDVRDEIYAALEEIIRERLAVMAA
jgi:hypothetical protein